MTIAGANEDATATGDLDILVSGIWQSAGATAGAGSADATADSQTVTVNFTVPLAALLASFSTEAQADRVLVRWDTVSGVNNLDFNLWRAARTRQRDPGRPHRCDAG